MERFISVVFGKKVLLFEVFPFSSFYRCTGPFDGNSYRFFQSNGKRPGFQFLSLT